MVWFGSRAAAGPACQTPTVPSSPPFFSPHPIWPATREEGQSPMPSPPPAPEESTPAAFAFPASAIPAAGINNRPPPFARGEDDFSDSESDDDTEDDEVNLLAEPSMPSVAGASKIQTIAAASASPAAADSEGRRRPVAAAMDDSRRLFQRLFTDADEMAILEGFYQFTSSRGTTHHPHQHDTGPFYNQIRARLQLDFSKNQLVEKLRRLKKKYRTAAAKIDAGRNFTFKSPHDKAAYEVSRKIWSTAAVPLRGTAGGDHDDMEDQNDHDLDNGGTIRKRGRKKAMEPRVSEAVPVEVKAVQSLTPISMPNAAALLTPAPLAASASAAAAAAAAEPPSSLEVPVSVVEETVTSCVAPLFRDLLSCCTINGPWLSVNPTGMMPTSFGGSSKGSSALEEKWRQQQILELQVFSRRLELVQEKIKQELEELRR